jgi:hypothetical protein
MADALSVPYWTRRAFAAKRLYITAQGFSPGLVARKGALKVAPDVRSAAGMPREQT